MTLNIRKATIHDIHDIFTVSNDPIVRQSSFSTQPITFAEHQMWFKEILHNPSVLFYVLHDTDTSEFVAQIRYKKIDTTSCDISISIATQYRGKHVASQCLSMTEQALKKEWSMQKIIAEVKEENHSSNNFFIKNNFHLKKKYNKNNCSVFVYEKKIGNNKTFIIAELSANHGQKLSVALDTIKAAKEAGADAVKIQTYTPDTITINCQNKYFQINQGTLWDGTTLYDLYKKAYTPWEWHKELYEYAQKIGIQLFSSPFDTTAVDFLETLDNPIYKIASFELNDIPLIEYVASKGKPIIMSTGIATLEEIEEAIQACKSKNNYDITILKCTSSYPAPLEEANLLTIPDMIQRFKFPIGLSDHTMGDVAACTAVVLGATVIEKHFILDRSLGGPDADFSMEPQEFASMVMRIRDVEKTTGHVTYELSDKMKNNRKFARSLFAVKDIAQGEVFTNDNVRSIRPSDGMSPKFLPEILGKKASKDITFGEPLLLKNIIK